MHCTNAEECFQEIGAYLDGEKTGHFLLINTENYDFYQDILHRFQAAHPDGCIRASENCYPNGFLDRNALLQKASEKAVCIVIGFSQALMLRRAEELEAGIREALEQPIRGRGVLLLEHCETILQKLIHRDPRREKRILLAAGEPSALPRIKLVKNAAEWAGSPPCQGFQPLLAWMEQLSEEQLRKCPVVAVINSFAPALFAQAVLSVTVSAGVFEALSERYAELAGGAEKNYGSEEQWSWLAAQTADDSSFSAFICRRFGGTANLSVYLPDTMESGEKHQKWLLWLSMKIFGVSNHPYLDHALKNSRSDTDLLPHIYLDLAEIPVSDPAFPTLYAQRRKLLDKLPESLPLVKTYCERLDKYQKEKIFYLTDGSSRERFEFVRCLSTYDYTRQELDAAVHRMSNMLSLYMREFVFDMTNTKLPESDAGLRKELTAYFEAYKRQKLTNRVDPAFTGTVEQYAHTRPYNKLPPRSSIVSRMERKDTQLFFFDALGVEYLAFILAKCEEYGMLCEVAVAHCELPSITAGNKEFLQYFPEEACHKIGELDEIKHHSSVYNYQQCAYPLHVFEELEVIDRELRSIQSRLTQGATKRAVIVSDHGASRLAVLYGHESDSNIRLEESGEHSGRCCPVDADPALPFAAYEGGFAILANYERFRGGRRANVEVHGGASLEETVVPVITLTTRPEQIEIRLLDPVIKLVPRAIPELMLYSNLPIQKPRLRFEGEFYEGAFAGDSKHIRFRMEKLKRKGDYVADVYDGDQNLSVKLKFQAQKQTREIDLLNL